MADEDCPSSDKARAYENVFLVRVFAGLMVHPISSIDGVVVFVVRPFDGSVCYDCIYNQPSFAIGCFRGRLRKFIASKAKL